MKAVVYEIFEQRSKQKAKIIMIGVNIASYYLL